MKNLFFAFFIVLLTSSCGPDRENFEPKDPAAFNAQIADRTDISTPEELILLYYNYQEEEGEPDIKVSTVKSKNSYEITLIHDRLLDDSMRAEKILMTAEKNGNSWAVQNIRTNWKCWEGRGHTDWGIEWCK